MVKPMPEEPPQADAAVNYRPISGLAVAAVLAAAAFVLVVLFIAVAVVVGGKPILFWGALAPGAVAVGLGLAARWQIAASEGTREGAGLANAAVSTSLIFGVAYAAYLLADSLAVQSQTAQVTAMWYDRLKAGDVPGAFLLNLEPGARAGIEAENPQDKAQVEKQNRTLEGRFGRGGLQALRQSELLQVIKRAGDKVDLTWRGAGDLSYEATGYRTKVAHEVHTPEGWFDVELALASTDGKEFVGLQRWHVQSGADQAVRRARLTRLGRLLRETQASGAQFGREFLKAAGQGDLGRAYLMTLPGDRLGAVTAETRKLSSAGGSWLPYAAGLQGLFPTARPAGAVSLAPLTLLGMAFADPDMARLLTLVGFAEFLREPEAGAAAAFRVAATPPIDAADRDRYRRSILRQGGLTPPMSGGPGDAGEPPRLVAAGTGPLRVEVPVEAPSPKTGGGRVKAVLALELDAPELQAEIRKLQSAEDWAKQPPAEETGKALIEGMRVHWRVVGVDVSGEPAARPGPPGGPDGPPGMPGH